jgi:hypothetical protein
MGIEWSTFKLPPVNLWSVPKEKGTGEASYSLLTHNP